MRPRRPVSHERARKPSLISALGEKRFGIDDDRFKAPETLIVVRGTRTRRPDLLYCINPSSILSASSTVARRMAERLMSP